MIVYGWSVKKLCFCYVDTELVSYGDYAYKGVDFAREIHGEMKRRWI